MTTSKVCAEEILLFIQAAHDAISFAALFAEFEKAESLPHLAAAAVVVLARFLSLSIGGLVVPRRRSVKAWPATKDASPVPPMIAVALLARVFVGLGSEEAKPTVLADAASARSRALRVPVDVLGFGGSFVFLLLAS